MDGERGSYCCWKRGIHGRRSGTSWTATMRLSPAGASGLGGSGWRGSSVAMPGMVPSKLTPALEARILGWTLKRKPVDGSTHWSTRKLGSALSISHMMVARVWTSHGLKPQRLDRYMASNDPDFERKAADIIGLYVNPPAHAAVFCVDEKTAIQALDRKDPVLPLSPGRAERHGFELY